jgi:hypothetical protein
MCSHLGRKDLVPVFLRDDRRRVRLDFESSEPSLKESNMEWGDIVMIS